MQQKPFKISGLIHAQEQILNTSVSEEYKKKLLLQVDKDLKSIGNHAQILGKQAMQRYYLEEIDQIVDSEAIFDCISQDKQTYINQLQDLVRGLEIEIEALEKYQNRAEKSEYNQALMTVLADDNGSIEAVEVITHKPSYKGIMVYPFLENGILFTKADLQLMLKILKEYHPEKIGEDESL